MKKNTLSGSQSSDSGIIYVDTLKYLIFPIKLSLSSLSWRIASWLVLTFSRISAPSFTAPATACTKNKRSHQNKQFRTEPPVISWCHLLHPLSGLATGGLPTRNLQQLWEGRTNFSISGVEWTRGYPSLWGIRTRHRESEPPYSLPEFYTRGKYSPIHPDRINCICLLIVSRSTRSDRNQLTDRRDLHLCQAHCVSCPLSTDFNITVYLHITFLRLKCTTF